MDAFQKVIFGQGMFVTSTILGLVMLLVVLLGSKVKALKNVMTTVKNKIMWSSIFRS